MSYSIELDIALLSIYKELTPYYNWQNTVFHEVFFSWGTTQHRIFWIRHRFSLYLWLTDFALQLIWFLMKSCNASVYIYAKLTALQLTVFSLLWGFAVTIYEMHQNILNEFVLWSSNGIKIIVEQWKSSCSTARTLQEVIKCFQTLIIILIKKMYLALSALNISSLFHNCLYLLKDHSSKYLFQISTYCFWGFRLLKKIV